MAPAPPPWCWWGKTARSNLRSAGLARAACRREKRLGALIFRHPRQRTHHEGSRPRRLIRGSTHHQQVRDVSLHELLALRLEAPPHVEIEHPGLRVQLDFVVAHLVCDDEQ